MPSPFAKHVTGNDAYLYAQVMGRKHVNLYPEDHAQWGYKPAHRAGIEHIANATTVGLLLSKPISLTAKPKAAAVTTPLDQVRKAQAARKRADSSFRPALKTARAAGLEVGDESLFSLDQLGQMLLNENYASVNYRYSEADEPYEYTHTNHGYTLTPGEVFKAIDNLDYQSCEHPGWRTSEAFAFLTALREQVCRFVDDYESAPWGFDRVPVTA